MRATFGYAMAVACLVAGMAAVARADHPEPLQIPETCDIRGLVANMETVQRSPWNDGAPSAFTVTEVHLSVVLEDRMPHDKGAKDTTCRITDAKTRKLVYKLCSPTTVKPGDRIQATEGNYVLNSFGIGCLFDVAVLPRS